MMWIIKKASLLLCCLILCGLIGCGNPDTAEKSDTYSGDFKSDEKMPDEKIADEKAAVSINNYITVNTNEPKPSDDTGSSPQPQKEDQRTDIVETAKSPAETPKESDWVQTKQGHKFHIPDGFLPDESNSPEIGSYHYYNSDLQAEIWVWEDTADHLDYDSGWEWIAEEYHSNERFLYETTQEKADNYFEIQGLTQEADITCIRNQFIDPWVVEYRITLFSQDDPYRNETFQRICREFKSNFQYAASSAPTEAPVEFTKKRADEEERKVAQIRSWYYAFQEQKENCTQEVRDNATAYYLNGEVQSIELLNYNTREFYYYAPGNHMLYFVYLEGMSDNTDQKRVYIWDDDLVQWIDRNGTVQHDDPEELWKYCCQIGVNLRNAFDY